VELATDVETQALADATRGVTPAGLAAAAVSAPTADRLMRRDAAGRAQVAAPSAAADIARKDTVDAAQAAVQASLNNHEGVTTGVHGVGASTVESASGAQAKVNAHANLTNPHDATSAPAANRLMLRDAAGRARVAGPSAVDDIATKGYVDANFSVYPSGTKMVYAQATAPPYWTQDVSANDRMLRVVSGSGGGVGGDWPITGLTVGGTALTVAQMPSHGHPWTQKFNIDNPTANDYSGALLTHRGTNQTTFQAWNGVSDDNLGHAIGGSGGGQAHSHGISSSGSWRPAYTDVILAIKD
jgi:hypothetical protein